MVWEGDNAVKTGRKMLGATKPFDSEPGTIRGDLCIDVGRNVIHGSDAVESANHEIALWFTPEEIIQWESHSEAWVYENPPKPDKYLRCDKSNNFSNPLYDAEYKYSLENKEEFWTK